MYLSIVVPVFNEKESLSELLEQVEEALSPLKKTYEVIFVDDGSTDGTLELLQRIEKEKKNVQVYSFRRNLGKSYALTLGFQKAEGEYVATLDADLQDDPQDMVKLLQHLEENTLDLVTGWRKNRKDTSFKKSASRFFNYLISRLFKLNIHDLNCGLKVYRTECAKDLRLYGGLHRFIPLLALEMGYSVGEHTVSNRERKFSYSKYKASKVFTDLPDLFTIYFLAKYNTRPLHFFGKIGMVPFVIGSIILLYLTIIWFSGERVGTRPLLTFGVLFVIAGMQILITGLLADMIVHADMKKETSFPLKYKSK